MGKTRNGKAALACTGAAFLFLVIAFTTPNWLQNDGVDREAKFKRIGLWIICLRGYYDDRHLFETLFDGCLWVYREPNYIIHHDILFPFYQWTQFFMSLSMVLQIIGSLFAVKYAFSSSKHYRYQLLLLTTGAILTTAGLCAVIGVLIFGGRGHYREWMPDWEHNDVGYSFVFAAIGSLTLLAAGIVFLVEARRFVNKMERKLREEY